ncbi:MAG: PDZ domain-containing protein [Nanoarchaeota archaeon]|nr:PDZ domain-containing protein [Nanoarchaeota archaeon]
MSLKNLLKLKKEKIIIDLLIILGLLILVLSIPSLGYQKQFFSIGLIRQIFGIIITVLLGLVIYYPFACGATFIYSRIVGKEKKYEKKDLVFAVLFVLLFNPITYSLIIQGVMNVNHNVINQPCGIEIMGFAENSPAKDAGMTAGEIITSINSNKIYTIDSFIYALANKRQGDNVSITTNIGSYNFKTIKNPTNPESAFIGINVNQKYCRR